MALNNEGIVDVLPNRDSVSAENLEILNGALCPGFVNAHCHLELSHMIGKISHGSGLPSFLNAVTELREEEQQVKLAAMQNADSFMWENGIDLVGDISNTLDSLPIKQESRIHYHTFVEVIGLVEASAKSRLDQARVLRSGYTEAGLHATLAPHAPYSLSDKLRKLVSKSLPEFSTIHNQESDSEDQYFKYGTGKLPKAIGKMGLSMDSIKVTGKSSLRTILPDFETDQQLILVHNTYTAKVDMAWANANWPKLFWCSCPSANVYIEYRVPNVSDWIKSGATVCLGTDSLASNGQLSMVQELSLIQMRCPDLPTWELLKMASYNGAMALGMENRYGLLEKGRKSGLLLLSDIKTELSRITDRTVVSRLC